MKEIVMGLHWAPRGAQDPMHTVDLDALCVLLDGNDAIIEVVSPSRPRTATDSVVHTGNSHDGSSQWDDERIFVFLDALPSQVTQIIFCVCSASGHALAQVPDARCHISDARQEQILSSSNLAAGGDGTFLPVFRLCRDDDGWHPAGADPESGAALMSAIGRWRAQPRYAQIAPAS